MFGFLKATNKWYFNKLHLHKLTYIFVYLSIYLQLKLNERKKNKLKQK